MVACSREDLSPCFAGMGRMGLGGWDGAPMKADLVVVSPMNLSCGRYIPCLSTEGGGLLARRIGWNASVLVREEWKSPVSGLCGGLALAAGRECE